MRGKPKKGYTVTAIRLAALAVCQSRRFLESGSLHPPQAVLRRFTCTIKINSFQNFFKVLKTCLAGRKDFFGTLTPPAHCAGGVPYDFCFSTGIQISMMNLSRS